MDEYYCALCRCQCSGPESHDQHLRGKKHKRAVKRKMVYGSLPVSMSDRHDESEEEEDTSDLRAENLRLRAELIEARAEARAIRRLYEKLMSRVVERKHRD